MGQDIISTLMIHNIISAYRQVEPALTGLIRRGDYKYELVESNAPCRTFDINTDSLKDYKERGVYKQGMREGITKWNVQLDDILVIQDEVRTNIYVVQEVEFLSLSPLVELFKTYAIVLIPFSGKITLTDDTVVKLDPTYFGPDVR